MAVMSFPTDEERQMLRDSIRGLLREFWSQDNAIEFSDSPTHRKALWDRLVLQGLPSLGSDPSEGGVTEIALVMEELGRASCSVPMLGSALMQLACSRAGVSSAAAHDLLAKLVGGHARVCMAFGALDADPNAGALVWQDGRVSGQLRFVECAAEATHLVAGVQDPCGLALVPLDKVAVKIEPTRMLGGPLAYEVTLIAAHAELVILPRSLMDDLSLITRLLMHSRAYGAARRAFELVTDYAKERRQFGQPIGRFQAIQHKLANNLINLEGVRLTLANAAINCDQGVVHWRYSASAAIAFSSGALRTVSLENHHAFGAIGYAEEHEAPRHFRRVHADAVAYGGLWGARKEVASYLLNGPGNPLPAYDLGPEGNAFRVTVNQWLVENWSGERKATFDKLSFEQREFDASFAKDLGRTGWLGLTWPRQHGGQERSPMEQLAFIEEMERAETPRYGAAVQANALILFGTPEQQAKYLPEILAGEAMHGMGYSEPNSGSDLASLRTAATRDGDEWVINGQKIWTTTWWGKYMFLAARTDPDAKPSHAGISMFIVPMDANGITVNPAKTMYDGSFANIFYDNVRLPADALVGQIGGGWKVLTDALAAERGLIGGGIVCKVAHYFEKLCEYIRGAQVEGTLLSETPLVRDKIAQLAAEIEVGRQLMAECARLAARNGFTPPEYGAISKVFSGELMERFGEATLDIIGLRAALSQGSSGVLANGAFEQGLRHSLMWVISIGTNEIQRSLIAQRGLGMPR